MAQSETETKRATRGDELRGPRVRSRRLGRTIATVLVVGGLAYIIGVAFASVVPQVFWPDQDEPAPGVTCAAGLRSLRGALLGRASEHVRSGGSDDPHALREFLTAWDRRHRGLEARCGGEGAGAWSRLGRARGHLEMTLLRFDAEEGELAREVESTLARLER